MTMRISDENKEKLQALLKAKGLGSLDEAIGNLLTKVKPEIQAIQLEWNYKIWELPLEWFGYIKEKNIAPAIYVAFRTGSFNIAEENKREWLKLCIRDGLRAVSVKLAELKASPFRRPFFVGRIKRDDGGDSLVIWTPWAENISIGKQNL